MLCGLIFKKRWLRRAGLGRKSSMARWHGERGRNGHLPKRRRDAMKLLQCPCLILHHGLLFVRHALSFKVIPSRHGFVNHKSMVALMRIRLEGRIAGHMIRVNGEQGSPEGPWSVRRHELRQWAWWLDLSRHGRFLFTCEQSLFLFLERSGRVGCSLVFQRCCRRLGLDSSSIPSNRKKRGPINTWKQSRCKHGLESQSIADKWTNRQQFKVKNQKSKGRVEQCQLELKWTVLHHGNETHCLCMHADACSCL